MDKKQVASLLVALREQAGFSTKAAASRASGVSPQDLTRYEKGSRTPSLPVLVDYLASLGLTLHDLADALGQPCRHHLVASLPSPPTTTELAEGVKAVAAQELAQPTERDLELYRALHKLTAMLLDQPKR